MTIVADCGCVLIAAGTHPVCVTAIWMPATVNAPLRDAPLFAATVNDTAPLPDPASDDVIVIHGVVVDADHAQPALEFKVIVPPPPNGSNVNEPGEAVKLHTVTVAIALSALPHALLTRAK